MVGPNEAEVMVADARFRELRGWAANERRSRQLAPQAGARLGFGRARFVLGAALVGAGMRVQGRRRTVPDGAAPLARGMAV